MKETLKGGNKKMPRKKPDAIIHKGDIKYVCEKCSHIARRSVGEHLRNWFFIFFTAIGILSFLYFVILTTTMSPQEVIDVQINLLTNYKAYERNNDMRDIGIELAGHCGLNEDCIIQSVHKGLVNVTYVKTPTILDPKIIFDSKAGDCKNFAFMFVSILHQFGVDAYYDGSSEHEHAVAVAKPEGRDYYYVVDLTDDLNSIAIVGEGYEHWDVPVLN